MSTIFLLLVWGLAFRKFANQPAWKAVLELPCVLCAGLLAMHLFEPGALGLERWARHIPFLRDEADFLCLAIVFAGALWVLRWLSAAVSREAPALPSGFQLKLRCVAAALAGYALAAFVLVAADTSPPLRALLGAGPESRALAGIAAPDQHWLSFTRFVSHGALGRSAERRQEAESALSTFRQRYLGRTEDTATPKTDDAPP